MAHGTTPDRIECGPLTVHLPDASDPTFWLMHDLARLFGHETNREAELRLKKALRESSVRGLDIDAESDWVFVDARTPDAMVAALRVIRQLAPNAIFNDSELDAAGASMRAWRRPAAKAFDVGDVFAVPLTDDAFGAVQILAFTGDSPKRRGSPIVLALDLLSHDLPTLQARIEAGDGVPIAARQTPDSDFASGAWPQIGRRPLPTVDADALTAREHARSGSIDCIVASCLGVDPWEMFDPHPHEPYLLDGVVPPFKKRRREVFEQRVTEVFREGGRAPTAPVAGAATLHVVMAYRGGAEVPVLELPKLRDALREVSTLECAGLPQGEGCVGGGYDGAFDVFVHVDDIQTALGRIDAFAIARSLTNDLYVEAYPRVLFDWRGTLRRMRRAAGA